jgi:putative component of membrane protein insertase Oxa1/YidC/SpoIIIJ protein YidD
MIVFAQIATNDLNGNIMGFDETEAERYVLNKKMTRPPISCFSIGIHTFIFLYSIIGLNFLILCLSHFGAVISSKNSYFLTSDNPVASCIVVTMISFFITLLIFSKRILIGLVHIYQRYAPESRRRMCLFKPTCSEYAILALNKYGSIRGTIKTIDRLKRCKGGKYHIDYP